MQENPKMILDVILLSVVVERITEIITTSKIADIVYKSKLKSMLYNQDRPVDLTLKVRFLKMVELITDCGYCASVWVAFGISVLHPSYFNNPFFDAMLLHGGSNLYHVIYELLRRGRINTHDIRCAVSIEDNNGQNEE